MTFRRGEMLVTDSTLSIVELDDIPRDAIPGSDEFGKIVVSNLGNFAASQISPKVMPKASSVDVTGLALNIFPES
jgi:hypothetical protein